MAAEGSGGYSRPACYVSVDYSTGNVRYEWNNK